jgi:hypothetical protein
MIRAFLIALALAALSLWIHPAGAQTPGTLNLTGPSTTPGAPQLTPQALNGAINAQLGIKFDAINGVATNPTLNGTIAGTGLPAALAAPPPIGGTTPGPLNGIVTPTGATTARTLADSAAGCDADSTHCTLFDMKARGMSATSSAAANLAALQQVAIDACNVSNPLVRLPPGSYTVAAGEVLFMCQNLTFEGAGSNATALLPQNTTQDFLHFKAPANLAYAGGLTVRGFRIFMSSNPTAGALLKLDHAQFGHIDNVEIEGGFIDYLCISCLSMSFDSPATNGGNTTAGSKIMEFTKFKITQSTSVDTPSGNVLPFTNTAGVFVGQTVACANVSGVLVSSFVANTSVTLSGAVSGDVPPSTVCTFTDPNNSDNHLIAPKFEGGHTTTDALVVTNSDGLDIIGGHIGFVAGNAFRVQPLNVDDAIDGIACGNASFDTAQYGVHFMPIASFVGKVGFIYFTGCNSQNTTAEGFRVDAPIVPTDPWVDDLKLTGWGAILSGTNGINFQGGQNIAVTGGTFKNNNLSAATGDHILIAGATSRITVSGATFAKGTTGTVVNDIEVLGTADYFTIGPNTHTGASTKPFVHSGSVGTHYAIYSGANDANDNRMEWNNATAGWTMEGNGANWVVQNSTGSIKFGMNQGSGIALIGTNGANQLVVNANGSVSMTTHLVSALPGCVAGLLGQQFQVSDATAPAYGVTLVGGGAVPALAICDGSTWKAH